MIAQQRSYVALQYQTSVAVSMNERRLIAVGHSKAAVPDLANSGRSTVLCRTSEKGRLRPSFQNFIPAD